jgi:hypothetical protein
MVARMISPGRSASLSASLLAAVIGFSSVVTVVHATGCASSSPPPPAVGGDDKPVRDPDELDKGEKKGPVFYSSDAPPDTQTQPPPSTPSGPPNPDGPVRLTSPSVGASGAASVRLLSPGAEPLEKRVYAPKVGAKETFTIVSKTSSSATAEGQAIPGGDTVLPPATFELALVIKEVNDTTIKADFTVKKAVAAAKTDANESILKFVNGVVALKGASGTLTTSRTGLGSSVTYDRTDVGPSYDLLTQLLDAPSPSVPLPDEPIGEGAKWEVRVPVAGDGIRLNAVYTYELTSFAKGKGKVSIVSSTTAPSQDIDVAGMPGGGKAHLNKRDGSGQGSATFDLTKLSARSSSLSESAKSSVAFSLMGSDIESEMLSKGETKRTGK